MARVMDLDHFEQVIRPMIAMYGYVSDELVSAYWRVLRTFELADVAWAVDDLLGQETYESKRPTASQIKSRIESRQHGVEQGYLQCQQRPCQALVPWPNERTDEGRMYCRMYCPMHQPEHGEPATLAEKIEIAKGLTPKARAFLRSAMKEVAPQVMAGIPVTPEEADFTEPEDRYKLVKQRKEPKDIEVQELYGATEAEMRRAQHDAHTRTLAPL